MIINVPTPAKLNDVSLRLYFSAWSSLIEIWSDFCREFEGFGPLDSAGWDDEWMEYLQASQAEMQSIFSLVQHSNELALKAMVCEVSPYLLLIGNDLKLSSAPTRDLAFSDFRTIDAVDLPAAVNNFCPRKLTARFVQTYSDIRAFRNRFVHLGLSDRSLDPFELLRSMIAIYAELWPQRSWLKDRVTFASQERIAFFADGRVFSVHEVVMEEQKFNIELFTKSEFKIVFGDAKSKRRYFCFDCVDAAKTKWFENYDDSSKTAFISSDNNERLRCAMCCKTFTIKRLPCGHDSCKGNVIGDHNDNNEGRCHSCGEYQNEGND